MDIGKLPQDMLAQLVSRVKLDPRVVVGPGIGEDAAVIDFGQTLLVAKTDPITFATDRIGAYAVHVNANDIAVMGADPKWFLAAILLPETATPRDASAVFDQVLSACDALGISLVGGHTETALGIDRPIVVGCMLGEVKPESLVTTAGASPGDTIMLAGGIAIEGTALLAREAPDALLSAGLTEELIEVCRNYLVEPGISVVRAAKAATEAARVHSMHDPTEGGLATGLAELAAAAGVGVEVEWDMIPILEGTAYVCRALGLDPLGLIASGSLLLTLDPSDAQAALIALDRAGIAAAAIGRVTCSDAGLKLRRDGKLVDLPRFSRDEIARFFAEWRR